jgi:raffinose/stachyose/melibiose transport system substrate-binding protein
MHAPPLRTLRHLATALLATLLIGAVAAQNVVEISVAHTMTGGAHRDAFDRIIEAFHEAHPTIRIRQIPQDMEIYQDTGLIAMLQSNDPPDIWFQWGGDLVRRDAELGFALDLTDYLAQDGWGDSFLDASWSEGTGTMVGDRIFMMPYAFDVTTVLWYNTDIFAEHGLSEPETWDEFLDIVRTLRAAGVTPIILGNQQFWPLGNWAGHITARVVGMDLFDKALSLEVPFNQPAFEEAFQRFAELAEAQAFNRDLAGLGASESMAAFFQGAGAMHPIGSWLISNAFSSAPDGFSYDAFNTPVIAGGAGDPQSIIGLATGFEVSSRSAHVDEAITFLRFFTSFDHQVAWAEAGRFSPIEGAMAAAEIDVHNKALAELFLDANELVPPPDTGYPVEIADIFYQGAALVAGGLRSPAAALAWIDEQLALVR